MARRRSLHIFLSLLALFLFGTVVVLSSISYYLAIPLPAYLQDDDLAFPENGSRWNATEHGAVDRIPRIIHQTWRSNTLPDRWTGISQACRSMMPDFEYMLWTDASSREFIQEHYPWFLDTFDAYTYPIQRADAIRYFVLYHYGGVYIDLDVGCLRPLDPLLIYPVILPKTIPVGVSNDLMLAEKGHPFMAQTIHNLATFDHSWILNYPTVMFSTGPMFLSAQCGIYTARHPPTPDAPHGEVRILPKSLYGKNAKIEEAPHAFFSHYYGSSWHADDAAFIGFLGKWGKGLMWLGLFILVLGILKPILERKKKKRVPAVRRLSVLLPSSYQRGRWQLDLRSLTVPTPLSISSPTSPISLTSSSPLDDDSVPMVPFSFDVRPFSPSPSEASSVADTLASSTSLGTSAVDAVRRAGNRMMASITGAPDVPRPRRGRQSRRVLFFLPAFFTPAAQASEAPSRRSSQGRMSRSASASALASLYPSDKRRFADDVEAVAGLGTFNFPPSGSRSVSESTSRATSRTVSPAIPPLSPPPYISAAASSYGGSSPVHTPTSSWSSQAGCWDEWESQTPTIETHATTPS